MRAAFVRHLYSRAVPACAAAAFALLDSAVFLHRLLQPILSHAIHICQFMYSASLLWLIHSLGRSPLCAILREAMGQASR